MGEQSMSILRVRIKAQPSCSQCLWPFQPLKKFLCIELLRRESIPARTVTNHFHLIKTKMKVLECHLTWNIWDFQVSNSKTLLMSLRLMGKRLRVACLKVMRYHKCFSNLVCKCIKMKATWVLNSKTSSSRRRRTEKVGQKRIKVLKHLLNLETYSKIIRTIKNGRKIYRIKYWLHR